MLHLRHQETPSRILRRIKEAENDSDMPSLPSMASMDGSEEEEDDDDTQSRVKGRRTPRAINVTSASSSFSSMGRTSQSKSHKQHQNKATTSSNKDNNTQNSAGRNILSPLKLNARQSPSINSSKGKGKATPSSESPSPGRPLSAVSSNRTVRPANHDSPHGSRGTSVTPSIYVTSRYNKPSQRIHSITLEDSLPSADVADHSSEQQQQQQQRDEEQSETHHEVSTATFSNCTAHAD